MARADLATAEARIERALVAQPKSSEALLAKSQLLRLKNDAQGAISVLDARSGDGVHNGVMRKLLGSSGARGSRAGCGSSSGCVVGAWWLL